MVVRPLTPAYSSDLVLNCFCPALRLWEAEMHPKVTEDPWHFLVETDGSWWPKSRNINSHETSMTKFATHPAVHLAVHNLRTKNQTLTLKSCQKQNQIRPHHPAAALECILLSKIWEPDRQEANTAVKKLSKAKNPSTASCRIPWERACNAWVVQCLSSFVSITFLTCSCAGVPAPQKKAAKN